MWGLHVADAGSYTLTHRDRRWTLTHGIDPDVTVTTDTAAWTRFLMTPPHQRSAHPAGVDLAGTPAEIDRFLHHIAPFPHGLPPRPPTPGSVASRQHDQ